MFIDRHQELAALEQMFQSELAEFVRVVWQAAGWENGTIDAIL